MNLKEYPGATGEVQIEVFGPDGQLKERVHVPNTVVQVGRNYIAARMTGNDGAYGTTMSHMACGTSTSSPTIANTRLGAEGTSARVALTSTTVSTNRVTYIATFPPGTGTGAITEAGIFNHASRNTGSMLCRTTFAVVNKTAADTITITWAITIS